MSKHKYYTADPDKLQKKLESIGSGTYFKPKQGPNKIRILPPWSKEGIWYKEATLHYGLHDENDKERAYPCLKMFGERCPICDKREELLEGDGEDKKVADRLRPRTKFYANILDLKTNKVMIWGFSQKILGTLLSYESDPDHCDNKLTDPDEGFNVVVEREGTTKNDTRYQVRVKPKPSAIEAEDWEDHLFNLDTEVIEEMSKDDLEDVLTANFGSSGKRRKDEDDDEDEPRKKKKHEEEDDEDEEPRKKHKKSDEEEDDDKEDEDDDKEDDDEDRKEKKKRHHLDDDDDEDEPRKKKKHSKDEEDEDDKDDEDD